VLRELVQRYALRAREFSDAVARLGEHAHIGPEFLQVMEEIKRLHVFCSATENELDRYIAQAGEPRTSAHG
jgi:hypothetical protein